MGQRNILKRLFLLNLSNFKQYVEAANEHGLVENTEKCITIEM